MPSGLVKISRSPMLSPALRSSFGGLDSCHRRLDPIEPAATDEFVDQHDVTAAHRAEDRACGDARQRLADRFGQVRGAAVESSGQRGSGRAHADGRGRSRVHAAEHRIHRPGHHLLTEPVCHQVGDGGIAAGLPVKRATRLGRDVREGGVVHQTGHRLRG